MSIIELLTQALTPHECLRCGSEGSLLCDTCCRLLPPPTPVCCLCSGATPALLCTACRAHGPLEGIMAAASYEAQAKELLYALKFERKRAAAEPMATLLARQMTTLSSAYLVVHLPTANARVRLRGYDQAQQIARGVARNLGLPYAALLSRQGARRQVGQDRATRQSQMHDALYVANPRAVAGRSILLIDDVITTGASIVAAASVLRAAGARRVTAAAFAIA